MAGNNLNKRRRLLKIMVIAIILCVCILAVVYTVIANNVISSMADVRIEKNDAVLGDYGLIGEQVSFLTEDGISINAYIVENQSSKGNVLILHGMHGMDATSLFDYAKFIFDAGYTPVVIDMRSHGKSEGSSLSFGYLETLDVIAAVEYLKGDDRYKDQPTIIYGLSMGASTAINTAAVSESIDGVIAISPFMSLQAQVYDYMKNDGAPTFFIKSFMPFVNLVLRSKFGVNPIRESPEYRVKEIKKIPIFFVHGDIDSQTEVHHTELLYDNCSSSKKELWIVENADHLIVDDVLADSSKYYRNRIIHFLDTYFAEDK